MRSLRGRLLPLALLPLRRLSQPRAARHRLRRHGRGHLRGRGLWPAARRFPGPPPRLAHALRHRGLPRHLLRPPLVLHRQRAKAETAEGGGGHRAREPQGECQQLHGSLHGGRGEE